MMRVGIAGIDGRVGRLLVEEIERAGGCLIGGVGRTTGSGLFDPLRTLASQVKVVIDFTHPDATAPHAAILAEAGVAWVLGTTGLSRRDQEAVDAASRRIAVVQAPNFSPGVALFLDLAARMAAALPATEYDAEIIETHHRHKIDAPSGTALAIGEAVRAGRGGAAGEERGRDGQTGPRQPGAIGYASLRGGEIVGEHGLQFIAGGEQISLSHRAFDRRVFATGAVRAALWTEARPPGLYGMQDVLGLTTGSLR